MMIFGAVNAVQKQNIFNMSDDPPAHNRMARRIIMLKALI